MCSRIRRPIFTVPHTGPVHRGTVVFLHGSGDAGPDLYNSIKYTYPDFQFRHLKILFPTAPKQPYTPIGGEISTVWFDRKAISRSCNEIVESVDLTAVELTEIIKEEIASGTPPDRIVIGGFSMGGAMAMHLAFRYLPSVAGIFALSSFLSDDTALTSIQPAKQRMPPLYQWHGSRDAMVPFSWGSQTFQLLQDLGIEGEFHVGANALHELPRDCLVKLKTWIQSRLPDVKQPKI